MRDKETDCISPCSSPLSFLCSRSSNRRFVSVLLLHDVHHLENLSKEGCCWSSRDQFPVHSEFASLALLPNRFGDRSVRLGAGGSAFSATIVPLQIYAVMLPIQVLTLGSVLEQGGKQDGSNQV